MTPELIHFYMNRRDADRALEFFKDHHAQLKEWVEDGEMSKREYRKERRVVCMLITTIKRGLKNQQGTTGE